MHPTRAAQILATFGGILLLMMLTLRGVSLASSSQEVRAVQAGPVSDPSALPARGSFTVINGGKEILFEEQVDLNGRTSWFSIPAEGGLPIQANPPAKTDLGPFGLTDGKLVIRDGNTNSEISGTLRDTTIAGAALSPDQKSLAFAAYRPGGPWGLYILHSSGKLDYLGDQGSIADIDWSFDSRSLVFIAPVSGTDQVFLLKDMGQDLMQITYDAARKSSPQWSPDGGTIAYLSSIESVTSAGPVTPTPYALSSLYTPLPNSRPIQSDVYLISASGGSPRRLTDDHQPKAALAWITPPGRSEVVYAVRLPERPETEILYASDPGSGKQRRAYPPVQITALQCPSALPRGGSGDARITITNTALVPVEAPLLLRAAARTLPILRGHSANVIRSAPVTIPPGQPLTVAWPVPTATGLVTHISALINQGETFPMSEMHCVVGNTYAGLPNLPFLPFTLPVVITGVVLCIPWLLQQKKAWLWVLILSAPLLVLALIWAETSVVRGM